MGSVLVEMRQSLEVVVLYFLCRNLARLNTKRTLRICWFLKMGSDQNEA